MKFIDNTGHIFDLQDYTVDPIGYQYEISPYIFWIDSDYSTKLSVNNWYVKPIRFLCNNITDLNIVVESEIFKLYNANKLSDNCDINETDFVNSITLSEVVLTPNVKIANSDSTYNLITFYVFCKSVEIGSIFSNIKIQVINNNSSVYCPITIGANFIDESEELIINAQNMGIQLPKDILCAIYQNSSSCDFSDVNLYNLKLKEYLLNHMLIKGQCGNYNSAEASLEWFGWGDNIILSRLLKTDNEFKEQFVNDYFSIESDIQECFIRFKTTSLLSLSVLENRLTDKTYKQDFNKDLVGEGNPIIEDLINKTVIENIGRIKYVKNYYDFSITDLSAKLACLQYMYKKYFLPVHLSIHSASIKHNVINTPIKLMTVSNYNRSETVLTISDKRNKIFSSVEFTNDETFLLKNNKIYVDKNYNRFALYNDGDILEKSEIEYINIYNTLSAEIPIKIQTYTINNGIKEEVFDKFISCVLILSSDNNQIFESQFSFVTKEDNSFISFNIIPYLLNNNVLNKDFWNNKQFRIDLLCNGYWYTKEFRLKTAELDIIFGNVKYKYDNNLQRQIKSISDSFIEFNVNMYEPKLTSINDANFYDILKDIFIDDQSTDNDKLLLQKYINSLDEEYNISDNKKYWNNICLYNITDLHNMPVYFTDKQEFKDGLYDKYELNKDTIDLFKTFFDNNGNQVQELSINDSTEYDFYLMRTKKAPTENSKYYGIMISKNTLNDIIDEDVKKEIIIANKYKLTLVKHNPIFLIDRMFVDWKLSKTNIFLDTDMIAAKVVNNFSPVILYFGTRWKFNNISLNSNINKELTSNTQSTILPLYNTKLNHITGFYNVSVSYTIDNIFNHTETKKANLLIEHNETYN